MMRLFPLARRAAAGLALGLLCAPAAPGAQDLGLTGLSENAPIEVEASQGIEWRRDDKLFIARGDAVAKQGSVTVRADMLSAFYRELQGGGNQVYRIEATGNVHIASETSTLDGSKGVYDFDRDVMTVTGKEVVLVTPEQRVTADRSMEFDNKRHVAVATGNATVTRGDQRMRADVLTAHLKRNPQGRWVIDRIEGAGSVLVSTPSEIARADRGTYNLGTEFATLAGSVRITRGPNQLNGENAEVDMRTGVSRLTGAPGQAGGRVRALIVPGQASSKGSGQTPQDSGQSRR